MPYRKRHIPVKSSDKDWAIQKEVRKGKWQIVGRSTSPEKAEASIRARKAGKKKK